MKYMIMMAGGVGESVQGRSTEWVEGLMSLIMGLDNELRETGELVDSQKLADPSTAKTVRFVDSVAIPTDGPFAEIKESVAGYWIVEGTEERALEIAASVVRYTEYPMEVRQVMDQPPELSDR